MNHISYIIYHISYIYHIIKQFAMCKLWQTNKTKECTVTPPLMQGSCKQGWNWLEPPTKTPCLRKARLFDILECTLRVHPTICQRHRESKPE